MSNPLKSIISSVVTFAAKAAPHIIDGMTTDGIPTHDHVGHDSHFAENVRILYVNGVGSREKRCQKLARQVSSIFDNCRVDYVYGPLTFQDAYKALKNHKEPKGAPLLLNTLLQLHEELQSYTPPSSSQHGQRFLAGGERIICILHSGGGTAFESIKSRIPREVLERIDLITFGSAQLFREEGFRSVRNVVATNDAIPIISSVGTGHFDSLVSAPIRLTQRLGGKNPIDSHQFSSETYKHALEQVRHEYDPELSFS
jgi:hypothetical protein